MVRRVRRLGRLLRAGPPVLGGARASAQRCARHVYQGRQGGPACARAAFLAHAREDPRRPARARTRRRGRTQGLGLFGAGNFRPETKRSRLRMSGPLEGLKVLDISNVIAGPFAAALLGDFGADVLKVELPGGGDALRALAPHKDGKPLLWKAVNRNKRAITLDLRKPGGQALFRRLLPKFDVLIENYRPGTLDKWGLDKDALWQLQPKLVILRVTGFGQTGPYAGYAGFARLFEAYSGLAYITRAAGDPPMHPGYPIGDPISGVFGAFGVLVALLHRARQPDAPGQEIDLACTE